MTNGRSRCAVLGSISVLALAACEHGATCADDAGRATDDAAAADAGTPSEDAAGDDAAPSVPLVVLDHEVLALGVVCIGWPSTSTTLRLANAGAGRVDVSATLTGAQADQFVLRTSTCTGGLAAGAFCAINVETATTTLVGPVSADLIVAAGGARWTVPVTATVAHCDAAPLAPAAFSFGSVSVGARSTTEIFSIPNAGGELLPAFTAATLAGPDAAQFEIVRDGCTGHALVPGASCDLDVVFAPTRVGPASATLALEGYVSSTAILTGSGVTP